MFVTIRQRLVYKVYKESLQINKTKTIKKKKKNKHRK